MRFKLASARSPRSEEILRPSGISRETYIIRFAGAFRAARITGVRVFFALLYLRFPFPPLPSPLSLPLDVAGATCPTISRSTDAEDLAGAAWPLTPPELPTALTKTPFSSHAPSISFSTLVYGQTRPVDVCVRACVCACMRAYVRAYACTTCVRARAIFPRVGKRSKSVRVARARRSCSAISTISVIIAGATIALYRALEVNHGLASLLSRSVRGVSRARLVEGNC